MDFNTTLELIIKDLNDMIKIIDNFKSYQGVPKLHIELAKAKCKSSAEIIALLKKNEMPVQTSLFEDKEFIKEDIFTVEETVVEEKEDDIIIIEADKQPAIEIVEQVETAPPVENIVETQKPSLIIADSFADMPARINEQQSKHINNLCGAIGLNDKFLLIREIFNGNITNYEKTIAKIEQTTSLADAKAIISEYANPDDENVAMTLLLDLVKRKLNINE
jgi:hypothetical protein